MEMGGPTEAPTSNGAGHAAVTFPSPATAAATATGSGGRFKDVPLLPPDPIIDLNRQIRLDSNPSKVDLGIGAYRDDKGQPYILQVVKKVRWTCVWCMVYVQGLGMEGPPVGFIN
jgi:hypothetical protein